MDNNATQLQTPFAKPLSLGAIRASGWLKQQLEIQAEGLSGHLDQFWPDIANSRWFGGDAEGWERAPYWLDGFLPLAWVLDDPDLKSRAQIRINQILDNQQEDGWLGSRESNADGSEQTAEYDLWAQMLTLKLLVQYFDATGDDRIEAAVSRCLKKLDAHIDLRPLFNWGQARWFETLIAIWWLFERSPEPWLVDLAVKLKSQGVDWRGLFERWPYKDAVPRRKWGYLSHVVNNAMALREGALWWRLTGDAEDEKSANKMVQLLDQHHGMPTGVFSGDECLHGTDPHQGTELCAVVEYMFSLETLSATTGAAHWGDRLEQIAYNALPAACSPDMWSHQYDQQINQVFAGKMAEPPWNSNGRDANMFGLEPFFGCCTANFSQGWPKFTSHLWGKSSDSELVCFAWAPCVVETTVADAPFEIEVVTNYPFDENIQIEVRTGSETEVTLNLRIPEWAIGATLTVNDQNIAISPGTYHQVTRVWQAKDKLQIKFPMQTRLEQRPSGGMCIHHGPLLYGLKVQEAWQRINEDKPHRELPHADWEVKATSPWNYALVLEDSALPNIRFEFAEVDQPFSPETAPIRAYVQARKVPSWQLQGGVTTAMPKGDFPVSDEIEEIELIPYGATNLRIAEFPVTT